MGERTDSGGKLQRSATIGTADTTWRDVDRLDGTVYRRFRINGSRFTVFGCGLVPVSIYAKGNDERDKYLELVYHELYKQRGANGGTGYAVCVLEGL